MQDKGKSWVDAAADVQREQREISPQLKTTLSNVLRADLITFGIPADVVKEQIEFSFPEYDQKPSIRFAIKNSSEPRLSNAIKTQINDYIYQKIQCFNSGFCKLKESTSGLSAKTAGGYFRSDVTISASSTTDLVNGLAAMITNPFMRSELLKHVGVNQLGG